MSTIKQILRLHLQGKSIKGIAKATSVSKNTVKKYLQLTHSMNTDSISLLEMEDIALEQIYTNKNEMEEQRCKTLRDLLPQMARELQASPGVTRWVLWGEYRVQHPSGYGYSRFCYHLQQYLNHRSATMHIDQQPGEHLYVDFAGKKLEVVNPVTGEIRPVEVYVALLGYSQLTYVEATQSQKIPDFINASENAVHFFGGSPRVVVCDNLKTAIKKASTYEPDVNETFMDFANHYHMSVIPARPHKPKDKPLVENAVKIVYSRVYAALRHRTFFSLAELNQAIRECVEKHNRILFQGLQESRWDRFEAREKVILQTLPVNRFEIKTFVEHTVQKNCHIRLGEDKNYYSVPYRYIGQKVRVIYTQNTVSIYSQGQRIAFHSRSFKAGFYTTVPEHLTSAHRFYLDWSPEKFIQWALDMGEDVADYIKKVLDTKPHPEQAYKSCLGILTLAKKDSRENLRAACKRASELGIYNYSIIKNQLQNKSFLLNDEEQEKSCQYKLPFHENIRGASFYQ